MAYFNSGKEKDVKSNSDEWYELNPEVLEKIAGGAGTYDGFDTYRFWRDKDGVIREIR